MSPQKHLSAVVLSDKQRIYLLRMIEGQIQGFADHDEDIPDGLTVLAVKLRHVSLADRVRAFDAMYPDEKTAVIAELAGCSRELISRNTEKWRPAREKLLAQQDKNLLQGNQEVSP